MDEQMRKIKFFIDCYESPDTVKAILWELLNGAMESDIADSWDGSKRADMLFFYETITELIQALFQVSPALFPPDKNSSI